MVSKKQQKKLNGLPAQLTCAPVLRNCFAFIAKVNGFGAALLVETPVVVAALVDCARCSIESRFGPAPVVVVLFISVGGPIVLCACGGEGLLLLFVRLPGGGGGGGGGGPRTAANEENADAKLAGVESEDEEMLCWGEEKET